MRDISLTLRDSRLSQSSYILIRKPKEFFFHLVLWPESLVLWSLKRFSVFSTIQKVHLQKDSLEARSHWSSKQQCLWPCLSSGEFVTRGPSPEGALVVSTFLALLGWKTPIPAALTWCLRLAGLWLVASLITMGSYTTPSLPSIQRRPWFS